MRLILLLLISILTSTTLATYFPAMTNAAPLNAPGTSFAGSAVKNSLFAIGCILAYA